MSSTPQLNNFPSERPNVSSNAGHVPDRYVFLQQLGAGGMGVVHEAYDVQLDRKVAMKCVRLPPSISHTPEVGRRIQANLFR